MSKKKPLINKKIPKEYLDWTEERIRNIQKLFPVPVTKADAMRILAKTEGVKITAEMVKRVRRIEG